MLPREAPEDPSYFCSTYLGSHVSENHFLLQVEIPGFTGTLHIKSPEHGLQPGGSDPFRTYTTPQFMLQCLSAFLSFPAVTHTCNKCSCSNMVFILALEKCLHELLSPVIVLMQCIYMKRIAISPKPFF